jgi:hypothetical protein
VLGIEVALTSGLVIEAVLTVVVFSKYTQVPSGDFRWSLRSWSLIQWLLYFLSAQICRKSTSQK